MIEKRVLIQALATHGGPVAAAAALGTNRKTVYRAMLCYGLAMPRPKRVAGPDAWAGIYEQHHGSARAIAKALGMRDHKYVVRQLERYDIKPTADPWAGQEEQAA